MCDFGLARFVNRACKDLTECGTMHYYSPEKLEGRMYDEKDDMWAIGVVCLELATLKLVSLRQWINPRFIQQWIIARFSSLLKRGLRPQVRNAPGVLAAKKQAIIHKLSCQRVIA